MVLNALHELIGDPDGDRLHLRFVRGHGAPFEGAAPDFLREAVHFFLQLGGGLLERGKESPPLEVQSPPFAGSFQGARVQHEGAVERGDPRPGLPLGALARPVHGGPSPVVVVDPPNGPPPPPALALEEAGESPLELFARARVDDGVDAAVEVAQPEDNFEEHPRGLQGREEGTWAGDGRENKART